MGDPKGLLALQRDGVPQRQGVPAALRCTMTTKEPPPPPPDLVELPAGKVTTFYGQPVVLGPAHHVQSITPIATVPSQPIRKRHTKGWWKRQPPD